LYYLIYEHVSIYSYEIERNDPMVGLTRIQPLHTDVVDQVSSRMPGEDTLHRLADFFRVFGDFTRMKILFALFHSELCVYDIAALLGMQQSAVSHQLRVLKQAGLVSYRKEGKVVYYTLGDEHVQNIFHQSLVHLGEKRGS
jgi:DNA-binding transcriptional ArsR family regulator